MLFDKDLQEVEIKQIRYILRCIKIRTQELTESRTHNKSPVSKITEKNQFLQEHTRAST